MTYRTTVAIWSVAAAALVSTPALALDVVGSGLSGKLIGGTAERYWMNYVGRVLEIGIGPEHEAVAAFCSGTDEGTPFLLAVDRTLTAEEAATCRDNGVDAAVLVTLGHSDDAGSEGQVNVYVKSGHPWANETGGYLLRLTSEEVIGDDGGFVSQGLLPLGQAEREAQRAKAEALEAMPIMDLAGEAGEVPTPEPIAIERTTLTVAGVAIGMTADEAEAAPQAHGFTFKGSTEVQGSRFERPHASGAPEVLIVMYDEEADGTKRVVSVSRGVILERSMQASGIEIDLPAFEQEIVEIYGDPHGCEVRSSDGFRCVYADNPESPSVLLFAQGYMSERAVQLYKYDDYFHAHLPDAWAE